MSDFENAPVTDGANDAPEAPATWRDTVRAFRTVTHVESEYWPPAVHIRLLELSKSDDPTVKELLADFVSLADRLITRIEDVADREHGIMGYGNERNT